MPVWIEQALTENIPISHSGVNGNGMALFGRSIRHNATMLRAYKGVINHHGIGYQ